MPVVCVLSCCPMGVWGEDQVNRSPVLATSDHRPTDTTEITFVSVQQK